MRRSSLVPFTLGLCAVWLLYAVLVVAPNAEAAKRTTVQKRSVKAKSKVGVTSTPSTSSTTSTTSTTSIPSTTSSTSTTSTTPVPTKPAQSENPDVAAVSAIQSVLRETKMSSVRLIRTLYRFRGFGAPLGQNALMVVCDGATIENDSESYVQSPLDRSIPPPFVELLAAVAPGTPISGSSKPSLYTGVDPLTQRNQWFLMYFGNYPGGTVDRDFGAYDWRPDFGGIGSYCNGSGGLPGSANRSTPLSIPPSVQALDHAKILALINAPKDLAIVGHLEVGIGLLVTEEGSYLAGTSFCADPVVVPQSNTTEVTSFAFRGFRPSYAMFTATLDRRTQIEAALRASCP